MDTSPALGERQRFDSEASIYEPRNPPASEMNRGESRLTHVLTGFVLGAACWMVIAQLGIPNIFNLGAAGGEIPFGIVGALIGLTQFRRLLLWTSAGLVLLLAIIAFTGIVAQPARKLIRSDPVPASADAVVVLSSGVTADGLLPQQGSDRLRKALELMRDGVAPNLIVTRERWGTGKSNVTSAGDQDKLIAMAGVASVTTTGWARSTRDEATYVAAIARQRAWKRIVLVTSPFHSRRACATFEKAGLAVSCVPADSRDIAVRTLSSPRDRIGAFGMWIYEMAGTIRYRQRGWL